MSGVQRRKRFVNGIVAGKLAFARWVPGTSGMRPCSATTQRAEIWTPKTLESGPLEPTDLSLGMLERFVGLPCVRFLAVDKSSLRVHLEAKFRIVEQCHSRASPARCKDPPPRSG